MTTFAVTGVAHGSVVVPDAIVVPDAAALDQIAAILGLYTTDPGNNPVDEVLADIEAYVQSTGRDTNTPEGA